jgi:transcriptional regulator with XRE-family HTH domain
MIFMTRKLRSHQFRRSPGAARKARGLTQQQLADLISVTRRAIVYYERETDNLPVTIIEPLSKGVEVSVEELLASNRSRTPPTIRLPRCRRKLKVLEKFSEKDRKAVPALHQDH